MEKLFDPFVLLFTAGFSVTGIWFIYKVYRWLAGLSSADRSLVFHGVFSARLWKALIETISESLIHRKVFSRNPRLGYMHMSLAFGWFMLILIGNIESTWYTGDLFKPIYVSVFWRFFDPGPAFPRAAWQPGFAFIMDLFLLLVLSGLLFAIVKRFRSRLVGLKRTTRQQPVDRLALTALWLIFPARLIAESMTCGAHGTGSFLTGTLGHLFSFAFSPSPLVLPTWWFYSFILSSFFFLLPFTRYAHIPSEPVLIFLRRFGVRVSIESPSFTDLNLHACSSCGICLDACQLSEVMPGKQVQSNYFNRALRNGANPPHQWDCLLCGRCGSACPVGVELIPIRQLQRPDTGIGRGLQLPGLVGKNGHKVTILYFAGCMTHLTPGIISSMRKIFDQSGASWHFFDADGQNCCGRPLKLAGQTQAASELKKKLEQDFLRSGAGLLVTSCPICFRIFNEEYRLPGMRVLHHSQYISELLEWKRIKVGPSGLSAAYHEPCELGRGSGILVEPGLVIRSLFHSDVTPSGEGLCCGGSLGGVALEPEVRKAVARGAAEQLTVNHPDVLITACPLCKKTFKPVTSIPVQDIAEATAHYLIAGSSMPERRKSTKVLGYEINK
ncbi:MAG: hypothetical protein A2X22_10055 [Bacteroidetes bacterium GWF2_49_14]|nr:MAG: hypothetical protein A2X22_10055 [Bacteroidetes bacterium GWF2_49_14]HBB92329.1 hypothetical protein [Bacteroidales bacterium]